MYHRLRCAALRRSGASLATLALVLAGCAGTPRAQLEPGSNVREARSLLAAAASAGPVLVTWTGEPPLSPPDLLAAVERGVTGMAVRATSTGEAQRRFVFRFAPAAGPICGGEGFRPPATGDVQAAFCDGERTVSVASVGRGRDSDATRLIWQLTGRLVPDDYTDTYGFDLFGNRITFGAGVSF